MPNERSELLAELVKAALEEGPEKWPAFLERECASDAALRAEAESLLAQHGGARCFIETPALHLVAESLVQEGAYPAGYRMGDYEIISLIGKGGMGEVYLAQDRRLGRIVALKFIQGGVSSAHLLRHFKREENLLANLNHPHIAQLYGSGVTDDGSPFLAMEYVEGQRLDEYCNERSLATSERLRIFRKICSAVTYAHQHLVIHRDLKPANIRVTSEGEPKLLDFGIAKLLDTDTEAIGQTMTLAVMTPDYASPEQVEGESMTTASDTYSLGVVLYELLTGERPYRLTSHRPGEISRAITEQEPTRPSSARGRHSLRGDLDNIILMALRKEPTRRYSSVGQFSEDIWRHLEGLPVIARKDTWSYRSTKFVRRNRLGVAAAMLVFLTLIGGIVATAWEARAARHEKTKAESINAFLEQMINYSNPNLNIPRLRRAAMTVPEALDQAVERLENGSFVVPPEVRADLERIISGAYRGQGKTKESVQHLKKYAELQTSLYGENDPRAQEALDARALFLFNDGKMAQSENAYREMLPRARRQYQRGKIKAEDLGDCLNTFAYLRRTQGDSKEAEALFRESLSLSPSIVTRSTLASVLGDQGRFSEALATARQAVTEGRAAGHADTPAFGFSLTVFGGFLIDDKNFIEADAALQESEKILRDLMDPVALWLGDNLRNQAISLYQQNRFAEAQARVDETLKIYRDGFGPHYDHYPTVLITQGLIWNKTGRMKEAEAIVREALKLRTDFLPQEHFWIAIAKGALGECLTTQERFDEAEPFLLEAYSTLKARLGSDDPRTSEALARLATLSRLSQKQTNPETR